MGFSIRSNVASLNAMRSLNSTQLSLNTSLERLSSGYRINKSGDDAAGLAISENFRAQIRSLDQAKRNANDGVSMLQTAEGALNEISSILTRMRELGVQAASDTLITRDRSFLNSEFGALKSEIDRISEVTEFNGMSLLDGTYSGTSIDFQIGIDDGTDHRLAITVANAGSEMIGSGSTNINAAYVNSKTNAQTALGVIDDAINDVAENRASIGAFQNRLGHTIVNLANSSENITAANSRIRDVDVASESAQLTRTQILMQAGVAVLAQANSAPQLALNLIG